MFRKKCSFCDRKTPRKEQRKYIDDKGKRIIVCEKCASYAERRAYLPG